MGGLLLDTLPSDVFWSACLLKANGSVTGCDGRVTGAAGALAVACLLYGLVDQSMLCGLPVGGGPTALGGTACGGGCMTSLLRSQMLLTERSRKQAFLNLNELAEMKENLPACLAPGTQQLLL